MRSSQRFTAAAIDIGEAGDFFGEQVVPKLPAEVLGQLRGDGGASAAVLALDGDEAKHGVV